MPFLPVYIVQRDKKIVGLLRAFAIHVLFKLASVSDSIQATFVLAYDMSSLKMQIGLWLRSASGRLSFNLKPIEMIKQYKTQCKEAIIPT